MREGYDVLWVEGQGSILQPGVDRVAAAACGARAPRTWCSCHRAGQTRIARFPVPMPPLREVAALYESVASVAGVHAGAAAWSASRRTAATSTTPSAAAACAATEDETGYPTVDVMRSGADRLLDAVLAG